MNFVVILWSLFSVFSTANRPGQMPAGADTAVIDTTRYAVLPFNKNRDSFLFSKNFTGAEITDSDIRKIEKVITVTIKEYNKTNHNAIKKPGSYYKQLIAVTNLKGEKEVWVNCFCTPYEKRHWRKGVVMVLDGGPCFFNIRINLNTNTVMKFSVNGVA